MYEGIWMAMLASCNDYHLSSQGLSVASIHRQNEKYLDQRLTLLKWPALTRLINTQRNLPNSPTPLHPSMCLLQPLKRQSQSRSNRRNQSPILHPLRNRAQHFMIIFNASIMIRCRAHPVPGKGKRFRHEVCAVETDVCLDDGTDFAEGCADFGDGVGVLFCSGDDVDVPGSC